MKEVLLNISHGGFALSQFGIRQLAERDVPMDLVSNYPDGSNPSRRIIYIYEDGSLDAPYFEHHRDDPALIHIAKEYPHMANMPFCTFGIAVIPDDVEYIIINRDGLEYVAEAHRRWFPRAISPNGDAS